MARSRRLVGPVGAALGAVVMALSVVTPAPAGAAARASVMSTARAQALVGATYSDFTDAPASASSLAYWSGRVSSGATSQPSFVAQIASSGTSVQEQVSRLYYSILKRLPAGSALAARVALVQAHLRTVDGMAEELYASDEFFADHGGHLGPWIGQLYGAILGRVASSENIAHWTAVSATHGRLGVVEGIFGSGEARGDRVKAMYERMLHRAPTSGSLAHWIAVGVVGGDIAVASGLADSTEYARIATTRTFPKIDASTLVATVGLDPSSYEVGSDEVSGGTGPYSWTVLGLPASLRYHGFSYPSGLIALVGDLSLSPVLPPRPIAMIVRDSTGAVAALSTSLVYSLPASPAPIELAVYGIPGMTLYGALGPTYGSYQVGIPVSDQVVADGGVRPYSFAVVGGTLPPGLSLSSTGAITGTPTADVLNTVTIEVTDRLGHTDTEDTSWLTQLATPRPLTSVTSVTGDCALAAGHVYCWGGLPNLGSLPGEAWYPSEVPGLSGATLVKDDCAVANGGKVYCGIGVGSAFRYRAAQLPGLASVTDVERAWGGSADPSWWPGATCAVHDGGRVACWGDNANGALGGGLDPATTPSSATPVDTGLTGVTSLMAEDGGFCAVAAGAVSCWGANSRGQLGDGSTSAAWAPTAVAGLAGTTWLSAGSPNVCAIANAGQLWCGGANDQGQVADGTTTDVTTPHQVSGLSSVTQVSEGSSKVCAVATVSGVAGSVSCWGATNTGTYPPAAVTSPSTVAGISNATAVLVNQDSEACAIADPTASVWCWGDRYNGDGTSTFSAVPVRATGLTSVSTLYGVGDADVCAAKADGTLWCFGWNYYGDVGTGGPVLTPTQVVNPHDGTVVSGVTALTSSGSGAVYVVSNGGHLTAWGSASNGYLPGSPIDLVVAPYRI